MERGFQLFDEFVEEHLIDRLKITTSLGERFSPNQGQGHNPNQSQNNYLSWREVFSWDSPVAAAQTCLKITTSLGERFS
ncbi:hypothetical protein AELL_2247 [Arcobacter ellisii]|uniref:Uncharacterized protein n=1 Tax=Arcobacter ellisii TaxID=913109 RepID=A0ABM6YNN8_9BACT|nr:hypothetical protein AELL_2247 [Arcobacter ellisii]